MLAVAAILKRLTAAIAALDPSFIQTGDVLLLTGNDKANGTQNNTFIDSSTNNGTITRFGTTTQGTFSPFLPQLSGGSGYFGVAGTYLEAPTTILNTICNGAFGPVTIEAWIYLISNSNGGTPAQVEDMSPIISKAGASIVGINATNKLRFYWYDGSRRSFDSTNSISLNTWTHVAVTIDTNVTLYINGVQNGQTTFNGNSSGLNGAVRIGRYVGAYSSHFDGYMANLRVTTAKLYTTTFTPPTSPVTNTTNGGATPSTTPTAGQVSLLLDFTNAGIVDAMSKNNLVTVGNTRVDTTIKKYGTGSVYFDGTGDYLTLGTNISQFQFGSGDFTVEAWVYKIGSGTGIIFYGQGDGATASGSSYVFYVGTTNSDLYISTTSYGITSPNPALNTWSHVAFVRKGGTYTSYLNGVLVGTRSDLTTSSVNIGSTTYPYSVGGYSLGNQLNGYIDDLRVTKGVARYTSNFTPPTAIRAASSAQEIKNLTGTTTDGTYWISVNGMPTEIYCDMNTDGGGWMSFAAIPGTGNQFGGNTGSSAAWSGLSYSYGTYDKNGGTASSYWRNYSSQSPTQILFKTGNGTYWMRMSLSQISATNGTTYTTGIATSNNFPSDSNNYNSSVTILNRAVAEDPWINVGNAHAVGNDYMFWGENGNSAHTTFKNANSGILAFVR